MILILKAPFSSVIFQPAMFDHRRVCCFFVFPFFCFCFFDRYYRFVTCLESSFPAETTRFNHGFAFLSGNSSLRGSSETLMKVALFRGIPINLRRIPLPSSTTKERGMNGELSLGQWSLVACPHPGSWLNPCSMLFTSFVGPFLCIWLPRFRFSIFSFFLFTIPPNLREVIPFPNRLFR